MEAEPPEAAAVIAGVVVAGGRGERMGDGPAKALRRIGCSTLGARATRILSRCVGGAPVLYSTDADLELPAGLPAGIEVIDDVIPGEGPLSGLTASLESLSGRADRIVTIPCDMPLLHPAVIRRLISIETVDRVVATARSDGPPAPFPSVWPAASIPKVLAIFSSGERSLTGAMSQIGMEPIARELLLEDTETTLSDPDLTGLEDVDDDEGMDAIRHSAPKVRLLVGGRRMATNAWDLGTIAENLSIGSPADSGWVVNGRPVGWDAELPLVERDAVSIL